MSSTARGIEGKPLDFEYVRFNLGNEGLSTGAASVVIATPSATGDVPARDGRARPTNRSCRRKNLR